MFCSRIIFDVESSIDACIYLYTKFLQLFGINFLNGLMDHKMEFLKLTVPTPVIAVRL